MNYRERDVVRRLAAEVAGLAQQPIQKERVRQWTALNDLKPERPMVWITEVPWGEFREGNEELTPICSDPQLRWVEEALRFKLFTVRHFATDEVVEGVWRVWPTVEGGEYGVTIREQTIQQGGSNIESHGYEPVIKDFQDLQKIQMPRLRHNAEETFRRVAYFEALFGDILPVTVAGYTPTWFAAWDTLVQWTGVAEALMDLADRPDFLHALLRRMTDSFLARMTQAEEQGLLLSNTWHQRIGSGAAGYTSDLPRGDAPPGQVRLADLWGGTTAQIFSEVSPAMHEEFALNYEMEILQRCGLVYYGCCEPLHNKMPLMDAIPNLRKISISPWCDVAQAAERTRKRYVFSHKPSPAMLAADHFDVRQAEEDIRDRLARSAGMPCEFIMKDISTVRGDVQRVIDWCRIAHDVCMEAR